MNAKKHMAAVDRAQVARCVSKDLRSRCYSGGRALLALLTRRVTLIGIAGDLHSFRVSVAVRSMARSRWLPRIDLR